MQNSHRSHGADRELHYKHCNIDMHLHVLTTCIYMLRVHSMIYVCMYDVRLLSPFDQDPRLWSREEVALWTKSAAEKFELGDVKPEYFPMNGRGLVLLTKEMFLYRVPEGGGLLFEDIQVKLRRALASTLGLVARETLGSGSQL